MAGRYRKSINLGGGFKLNLNAKSVSISGGVPGARVTVNSKGQRTTSVGVPGTGLSYRTTTSARRRGPAAATTGTPLPVGGFVSAEPSLDPAAYPVSDDEKKFAKAADKSAKRPDVLIDWLQHPQLGQAAHIVLGIRRDIAGNEAMAFNLLAAVVRSPESAPSEGYFARHPLVLTLDILGVPQQVQVCRAAAALFVASAHNRRHEWQPMREALAHAGDSSPKVALEALCLTNLDDYDGVLYATRWLAGPINDPVEALSAILRAIAFREQGKHHEARMAFDTATHASIGHPVLWNLYEFERGRTEAVTPHGTFAARMHYRNVYQRDRNYPGLEEAMAELPPE